MIIIIIINVIMITTIIIIKKCLILIYLHWITWHLFIRHFYPKQQMRKITFNIKVPIILTLLQ